MGKVDISDDGRWLINVADTPYRYLGLGDKLLNEDHMFSIMDLENGKFVKWHSDNGMWVGLNIKPKKVLINETIYVEEEFIFFGNAWRKIEWGSRLLHPRDFKYGKDVSVKYQLVNKSDNMFYFQEVGTGKIKAVDTGSYETSSKNIRYSVASYDGRVLATAKAHFDHESSDGLITEIIKLIGNWIIQPWEIQFWDVSTGRLLGHYKGYGVDVGSINEYEGNGDNKFLESSVDGRIWVMTKNDGFIHIFDLREKVSKAKMNQALHY